jgi:hypothetical protein
MDENEGNGNENDEDGRAIAERNQRPPIAHTDEEEIDEADTMIGESKATGPDAGNAIPENSKEGGPDELPADDLETVDSEAEDLNEGSLQTDEQEEEVASDEPDTSDDGE